jgi:hypothetical protein
MKKKFVLLTVLVVFLASCTDTSEPDFSDYGYDYFPLEINNFQEYEVIDSLFSASNPRLVINRYQLQEVLADTFTDANKEKSFRLERFFRQNSNQNWNLDSVWTVRFSYNPGRTFFNKVVRIENNRALVKMVFPVKEGITWNGVQLNGQDTSKTEEKYKMVSIKKPYLNYPKTITVLQGDTLTTLVGQRRKQEIFAENIGLVFKESIGTEIDINTGQVVSGRKIRQVLINYGKK